MKIAYSDVNDFRPHKIPSYQNVSFSKGERQWGMSASEIDNENTLNWASFFCKIIFKLVDTRTKYVKTKK